MQLHQILIIVYIVIGVAVALKPLAILSWRLARNIIWVNTFGCEEFRPVSCECSE